MPLFDNKKASKKSLRDIPEGTTEKPKKGPGIIQWIKNSGHSVKGVFLEWLSEQQLFTVVNDEIKMIKKEQQKKKKMSPQEKKTFKQKVAALSDDAIKKFGELYLGTNSSQEAKEKIKEGIQTVLGQIKSGNFYQKTNQFGDEEFDAFMDDLEDEWDEDQEANGEVFMLDDIMNKKGFGEFMKTNNSPKTIKEVIKDEDGEELVIIAIKNKNSELTDVQKYTIKELKDPKSRNELNEFMKKKVSDSIDEMDNDDRIHEYGKIKQFTVSEDGVITCKIFINYYSQKIKGIYGSVEFIDLKTKLKNTSSESGPLKDILYKHGFGEFMGRSWVEQHIQEDVVDQDGEEITILIKLPDKQKEPTEEQKNNLEQLKKQSVRDIINQKLKNSLSKEISKMNDGNLTYSYYRVMEYTIFPNNEIEGAVYIHFKDKTGTMKSETKEFKYVPITIPKVSKESHINNILRKHGFGEFMKLKKSFDDMNEDYAMKTWGMTVKELNEYRRTHQGMTPLSLKKKQKLEQQRAKHETPKPEKKKYELNQYGEYYLDDTTNDTKSIMVIITPKSKEAPRPSGIAKSIVSKESEIIKLANTISDSSEFKKYFESEWKNFVEVAKDEGEEYLENLANDGYWDFEEDGDWNEFKKYVLDGCKNPKTIRFFYDEKTKEAELEFGFYAEPIFQGYTKKVALSDIGIQNTPVSESFIISNILSNSGLTNIVQTSKYNVVVSPKKTKKSIDNIIDKSGFGEFLKPGQPKFLQEEIYDHNNEALHVCLYYPKGETEINDIQKSILENLKDPKERTKLNSFVKNQLIKNRALDDEDYIIKYDKIVSYYVWPDGIIEANPYGWFINKSDPDQKPTYDEIGYDVEITRYEGVKK